MIPAFIFIFFTIICKNNILMRIERKLKIFKLKLRIAKNYTNGVNKKQ